MATTDVLKLTTPDAGQPVLVHTDMKVLADQLDNRVPVLYKKIRNTAAGAGLSPTVPVNLAPPYTIPASPFGAGVPYEVEVSANAQGNCPPGTGLRTQIRIDGNIVEEAEGGHTGAGTANMMMPVRGGAAVTDPDVTHTVAAVVLGATTVTINNARLLHVHIWLRPVVVLP